MIITKKKFGFHDFAEHLQNARGTSVFRGTSVKNQCSRSSSVVVGEHRREYEASIAVRDTM